MSATVAELELVANRAQLDARQARNTASQAYDKARKVEESVEGLHGKVDVLIGDVRALHAMRPKLDSLAALDLSDLSDAQKRAANRRVLLHRLGRLGRKCGAALALSFAGAVGLGLAFLLLHALHVNVPLELLRP
jgi:hypothetical protein